MIEEFRIPTMDDISLEGKKVIVRIDINVPLNPETKDILDDTRIKAHVPTIRELLEKKCAVVLMSHQGRPGEEDFATLEKHAELLEKHLGHPVNFVDDVMGPEARRRIKELKQGEVLLLDNIRFVSEELIEATPEAHSNTFLVRRLAPFFDVYINDAFATSHRSQPSIVGFPIVIPGVAGRLMEKEIKALHRVLDPEDKPKIFVLGGSKVSDTLRIIEYLYTKGLAERILTAGLVAMTFLAAKGINIGEDNLALLEEKGALALLPRARRLLLKGVPIETPIDYVVEKSGVVKEVPLTGIDGVIKDIGSGTIRMYSELIKEAKVLVMRGPAGFIEDPRFRKGTVELVKASMQTKGFVLYGGGHIASVVRELGADKKGHLSTGGGALLLFLSGETLPALEALRKSAELFLGWTR